METRMHGFELEVLDGDIHIDYNKELSKIPDPRQPAAVRASVWSSSVCSAVETRA